MKWFNRLRLTEKIRTFSVSPEKGKKALIIFLFLLCAFFAGRLGAMLTGHHRAVETAAEGNWGLSFQQEGQAPVANATMDYLKQYNAYYAQKTQDKVLYLTFDAGYENGNTAAILDALKKHHAPATFFVVGNYIETAPELVKRMIAEGHTVGNHTYHHPDMSKMSSKETFEKELGDLETLFEQTTGQQMKKYYRPPQGKYSEANLQMAKDMGYKTFFWSLAYVDWYQDKQPSKEEAFKKLLGRIHPGAIVLLHSTSSTNAQILDELLAKWEEMGYQFKSLDQLVSQ
ncbi:delta-lactam-biosynthetic de-N-acetylase [Lacrimispora amygdalina]|uniref:Delta-lactam-biosynthetic de-N-acetylase n=1 Tax=Lacrimispora amygdalina TaxID=253257 RepID=A0A3E2NAD3_9FIRM|nr:delta-lactam-biosynthetic de-N-acetylase [Clostridium indicum]RFZ77967.1 delta-lactam-biosynthetic de-N-acetylase [Clostridium indicum]